MHSLTHSSLISPSLPPRKPTYGELKAHGTKHFSKTCGGLVVRNRVSALNQFMLCRHKDAGTIGPSWTSVSTMLSLRGKSSRSQGRAARTIQDRLDFLLDWRELLTELADNSELPRGFREALNEEGITRREVSNKYLSKETGIAAATLKLWREGIHRPTRYAEESIKKLEVALRLPPGHANAAPGVHHHAPAKSLAPPKRSATQPTQYGERLRLQRKREYRLNYLLTPPESIRAGRQSLLAHKTNPFRERPSPREIWRCKPVEMTGHKPDWSELYAGQVVPAAAAAWAGIFTLLFWLALDPRTRREKAYRSRIGTLAWLLNDTLMLQFLAWMQQRSDNKIHRGIAHVLHCAASSAQTRNRMDLAEPATRVVIRRARPTFPGFPLTRCPRRHFETAWQEHCKTIVDQYEKQAKAITTSKACVKSTRNPRERGFANILALPRPLSALTAMLATLKRNPPWRTHTKRHAV